MQYLGVVLDTRSVTASPSPDRVSRLLSTAGKFLSSAVLPAHIWLSLLEMLLVSSASRSWRSPAHVVAPALPPLLLGLCGPGHGDGLVSGLPSGPPAVAQSSLPVSRDFSASGLSRPGLWSNASDVGWGAHLSSQVTSGLWSPQESRLPINAWELLEVHRGLHHFQSSLSGRTVAVFCDNVMVAYLRKEGGTRSPYLNSLAQVTLR